MFLADGPESGPVFIFAHGAGGAMDTPFMNRVANDLASRDVRVLRFEFPYMSARRGNGRKGGAPDRQPILLESWREAIRQSGAERPFIGGKSMGGRMASMIADDMNAAGLICLGYPFHPPGSPERLRIEHLRTIGTPTLIVQGTRDPFGSPEEVASYELASSVTVEWLTDGNHSFTPRKGSGVTESDNLRRAVDLMADFILNRD